MISMMIQTTGIVPVYAVGLEHGGISSLATGSNLASDSDLIVDEEYEFRDMELVNDLYEEATGSDATASDADELDPTVEELLQLIDALPEAEQVTEENREQILADFEVVWKAYEALSEDELIVNLDELIGEVRLAKLIALRDVLAGIMTMAATVSGVTVEQKGDYAYNVYANGNPLLIVAGDANGVYWSRLYIDQNRDGQVNEGDTQIRDLDMPNCQDRESGYYWLAGSDIYGGSKEGECEYDTFIALHGLLDEGYSVVNMFGGNKEGTLTGDTTIKIDNGNIAGRVYGGNETGEVKGNTNISMSSGTIYYTELYNGGYIYGGGKNESGVNGKATIEFSGGSVVGIYAEGQYDLNKGIAADVKETEVVISGGSVNSGVFVGNSGMKYEEPTAEATLVLENSMVSAYTAQRDARNKVNLVLKDFGAQLHFYRLGKDNCPTRVPDAEGTYFGSTYKTFQNITLDNSYIKISEHDKDMEHVNFTLEEDSVLWLEDKVPKDTIAQIGTITGNGGTIYLTNPDDYYKADYFKGNVPVRIVDADGETVEGWTEDIPLFAMADASTGKIVMDSVHGEVKIKSDGRNEKGRPIISAEPTSDQTAPVISNFYVKVRGGEEIDVCANAVDEQSGTKQCYYYCAPATEKAPDLTTVLAASQIRQHEVILTLKGLNGNTEYNIYAVAEDWSGNYSTVTKADNTYTTTRITALDDEIDAAIAEAQAVQEGVMVDERAADQVLLEIRFVSGTDVEKLKKAMDVLEDTKIRATSRIQIQNAITLLKQAVKDFAAAIKTGTRLEDTVQAEIAELLAAAGRAKTNIVVDEREAEQIEYGIRFVHEEDMKALDEAVAALQNEKENPTTMEMVNVVIRMLQQAIRTFESAIQTGTNTERYNGSDDSGDAGNMGSGGYVNSPAGIITGAVITGTVIKDGYAHWIWTGTGWKLQYADGTLASGTRTVDENGTITEKLVWELVNGAWYAFGADGYAKEGLFYDTVLMHYFYVDINTGMKTGWQQLEGVWYYFNPISGELPLGVWIKDQKR